MKKPHATLMGYVRVERISGKWYEDAKVIAPSQLSDERIKSAGRKVKFKPTYARKGR